MLYNSSQIVHTDEMRLLEVRMGKRQFLDELRRCLKGKIDDGELESNISYYSSYIDSQVAEGRTEEEVLSELGSPRLIAKTIIQTYNMKDDPIRRQFGRRAYEEADEEKDYDEGSEGRGFSYKIHGIPALICIVLVVLIAVSVILRIIVILLPLIVLVAVVFLIMRLVNR